MKRMLSIALGLLLIGSVAVAADFHTSGMTGSVTHNPGSRDCDWISQNFDPWTVGATQVACANQAGGYTTENWWGRIFLLEEDHYIFGCAHISQIAFGVEMVTASFDIEIVVYDFPALWPMPGWDALNALEQCRYPVTVDPSMDMTIVYVDTDVYVPGGNNIIVAVDAPDGEPSLTLFWSGANGFGATMDSYLAAESCALPDPTPVGAIGFPDAQTILNLCYEELGECDFSCGEPTPVSESSWGAVKSLYR